METYESVKSNPVQPEQKEKKKGGAWKGIVAVILAAGVVGSTCLLYTSPSPRDCS